MSSLTFGPEWLRALSSGDGGSSQSNTTPASIPVQTVKYKLAEFRYGREEMLALFSEDVLPPPELKSFEELTRGRPGSPLALQPLTEEEERSVHGGVNSALVVKIMGRGTPGRGRGGTRGGRGRSRGDGGPIFHRSISNEDNYSGRVGDGYGRRPWTESSGRGISSERGRGSDGPVQGRGFDPRQRGFSESGPRANPEPWRSPGTEDEEVVGGPGWRTSGQRTWRKTALADTSQNWRQDRSKDDEGEVQQRDRTWGRYDNEDPDWKSSNRSDSLPEWCNDDDDTDATPGTFDDSGQFRSYKDKNDHSSSLEKIDTSDNDQTNADNGEKVRKQESPQLSTSTSVLNDNESKSFEDPHLNDNTKYINCINSKSIDEDLTTVCETTSEDAVDQKPAMSNEDISAQVPSDDNSSKVMEGKEVTKDPKEDAGASMPLHQNKAAVVEEDLELSMKDMEHIVAELDDEEEEDVIPAARQELPKRDLQSIQDPSILFAKKAEPGSSTIKGMLDWIYRDPQGEIQGPFPSEEMLEWFRAGYFTMGLLVRRVCDEVFLPLGDVIKLWNRVPFSSGPTLPPISSQVVAAAQQAQRQQYEKLLQKQAPQQQGFRGGDLSPTQQLQQQQQQLQRQQLAQQQLQLQQQQMRQVLLQQLQVKSSKSGDNVPRPQSLDISQDATIWGDSPVQSPRTEPTVWNNRKSPQNVVELHAIEEERRLAEKQTVVQEALNLGQAPKAKLMHDDMPQKKEQLAGKQQQRHSSSHQQEVPVPKVGLEKEIAHREKMEEKQRKEEEELEKKKQRSEAQRRALENLQQQQQKMRLEQQKQLEQKKREEEELRRQHQEEIRRQQEQQHLLQAKLRQQHMQQQHQQRHMEMTGTPGSDSSPGWDLPPTSAAPSLLDIQRLEEEKQRAMLEKLQQLQNQQQLQQQQQRGHLSWASAQNSTMSNVKSLAEIQKEEAIQLAKERARFLQHHQQQQRQQNLAGKNYAYGGGAWNNVTSHPSDSSGMFWDDVMNVSSQLNGSSGYRRSVSKNNGFGDSAFPTLSNSSKQTNRKKKEEEVVQRLFQPSSPSDEFIEWIQAKLPKISESVDVPTFVVFLQSIDSPYELREYIQRYLGDNPDSRAFAKHFTDFQKRQNEAKKTTPVPITSPNEASMYGFDSEVDSSGKKKKKKKMQKVNPDLLGFSCNAATDTVNRGEIQFVEDVLKPK